MKSEEDDGAVFDQVAMGVAIAQAFRFQVGDIVAPRYELVSFRFNTEVNPPVKNYERTRSPVLLTIIERVIKQCHGGIQAFYSIRCTEGETQLVAEHEVVSVDMFMPLARSHREEPKEGEPGWRGKIG